MYILQQCNICPFNVFFYSLLKEILPFQGQKNKVAIWWLVGSSGGFLFSSPRLFILCFAAVVVNITAVCSLYVYSKHNRACRLLLSLCLQLRRPIITQHQPSSNYYHTRMRARTRTHALTESIIISLYVTAPNNKHYTP